MQEKRNIKYFQSFIVVLLLFTAIINANRRCLKETRRLNYYKVRSCHKSNRTVIFWKHVMDVDDCMTLARDRKGMAFNFIPADGLKYVTTYLANCQILGCAGWDDNSSLIEDFATDYYSAYTDKNYNSTVYKTCIDSVGFFSLTEEKQTYTESILACQKIGGDLADITTEQRTNVLSQMIKENVKDWYKVAYVGLDDIEVEGVFKNFDGDPLRCTRFRAWAPGHPKSKYLNQDCVILDMKRSWKVVECNRKHYGLCEIFPERPIKHNYHFKNVTCNGISKKDKKTKRICMQRQKLFEIYMNSSRTDKCALVGDI